MWLPKQTVPFYLPLAWIHSWDSFPVFIKICFIISLVALFGIVFAIIDIAIIRTSRKKYERQKALLTTRVNQLLLAAIVPDASLKPGNPLSRIHFDTHSFFNMGLPVKIVKKILVAEMINYRNYFSGAIADNIRKIYMGLSLHNDAIARLYKKNWETKVNAVAELFKMNIEVDHPYMLQLLHDKNRVIREFARLTLIKFTKGDPLEFLHELTDPLSKWEEFEIFQLFQQRADYTLGSLEALITLEKEPSVVSLSMKLAVYFKQYKAISYMVSILRTPNLKLRGEAICSIGALGGRNAEHYLVVMYEEQPHEIKLQILSSLGMIRSGQYLDFLENEFISSTDFEIKKYASDAIIKLYPLSKSTIDKLLDNSEALNHRILSHSLNPLINAV